MISSVPIIPIHKANIMKKILIILLAIFFIPITSFAMSLSTLQNNPERYLKHGRGLVSDIYVDTASIQSLDYDPPYYRMKITTYVVVPAFNSISAYSSIFDYDYYYSIESTGKRIIADMNENNEPMDEDVYRERLHNSIEENTGIEMTMEPIAVWTTKGRLISQNKTYLRKAANQFSAIYGIPNVLDRTFPIEYDSNGYELAQYIFHSYYNQYF